MRRDEDEVTLTPQPAEDVHHAAGDGCSFRLGHKLRVRLQSLGQSTASVSPSSLPLTDSTTCVDVLSALPAALQPDCHCSSSKPSQSPAASL